MKAREGGGDDEDAYDALAREIRREVERITADPDLAADALAEVMERLPRVERERAVREVFAGLSREQQWAVIERVYGDAEIAEHLRLERAALLEETRVERRRSALCRSARLAQRFELQRLESGDVVTLGLFREHDVRVALPRGSRSAVCARRVVLRANGDGTFTVLEDVFNPNGGYFVTADYDADTWRSSDRLAANDRVRVGTSTAEAFEPVLHPGGRVDVEVTGAVRRGRLHLGFVLLGGEDVFAS